MFTLTSNRHYCIGIALMLFGCIFSGCEKQTDTEQGTPDTVTMEITSETPVSVPAEGGQCKVTYTITSPEGQQKADAECDAEWIYGINDANAGMITFFADENKTGESRSTSMTVTYGSLSEEVVLIQEAKGTDVVMNATQLYGHYYGDVTGTGTASWWFFLSEDGLTENGELIPNKKIYRIDAYAPCVSEGAELTIPEGTYTLDPDLSFKSFTFTSFESIYFETDAQGKVKDEKGWQFDEAVLTVSDGSIVLDAVIDGKVHKVTYTGSLELLDFTYSGYGSTLKTDYTADLTGAKAELTCFFDGWKTCPYCNYWIEFIPAGGQGDGFILDFITDEKLDENESFGAIFGKYSYTEVPEDMSNPEWIPMSFIQGFDMSGVGSSWQGSSYACYSDYRYYTMTEFAPLKTGSIEIKANEDETITVIIDCYDDAPARHNIKAEWTGKPVIKELNGAPMYAPQKSSRIRLSGKASEASSFIYK